MGRGDNRRTRKVVQKRGQASKKSRLAKRVLETKTARQTKKKTARAS